MSGIKTSRALTLLLLCAAPVSFAAAAPVFTENFSGLADGTVPTSQNTGLTYVQSTGGLIQVTESGSSTPLLIQSAKAGNTTQGIGINLPQSSSVVSISFNFKINELTGGTSFRFALGSSSGSYYPASGALPSRLDQFPTTAWETFADQSAFVLNMGGNSNAEHPLGFGKLASLNAAGTAWQGAGNTDYMAGTTYNLHFVANGSDSSITLGEHTILAGHIAIYVDKILVSTVAMADNVTPDSFRIYTHGRSAGGGWQASAQIGEISIWDSAVAPVIPESTTIALALASSCLLASLLIRRRK